MFIRFFTSKLMCLHIEKNVSYFWLNKTCWKQPIRLHTHHGLTFSPPRIISHLTRTDCKSRTAHRDVSSDCSSPVAFHITFVTNYEACILLLLETRPRPAFLSRPAFVEDIYKDSNHYIVPLFQVRLVWRKHPRFTFFRDEKLWGLVEFFFAGDGCSEENPAIPPV